MLSNWQSVRSIGVVTSVEFDSFKESVDNFLVRNSNKELTIIRHFDDESPSNVKFRIEKFSTKEINWFCRPMNDAVNKFINEDFDILIFVNPDANQSLLWIYELSLAKFKIGYRDEFFITNPDLVFEPNQTKNPLGKILKETEFYLTKINN
ncbi:MAG: hypothetical protein JEZ03_04435 [Bacteroidales bacterium]|nr:hypothetical protein [Bacteroidales bacterium]